MQIGEAVVEQWHLKQVREDGTTGLHTHLTLLHSYTRFQILSPTDLLVGLLVPSMHAFFMKALDDGPKLHQSHTSVLIRQSGISNFLLKSNANHHYICSAGIKFVLARYLPTQHLRMVQPARHSNRGWVDPVAGIALSSRRSGRLCQMMMGPSGSS